MEDELDSVSVGFRLSVRGADDFRSWSGVDAETLRSASPWRTFRWYRGQRHYSGTFWSSTNKDHVIYESRLELARLLFADFDDSVARIVAQPFLLKTVVEGTLRKHIPDYLLFTGSVPVVVDVKPRAHVTRPRTAFTFAWTKRVVESRGWRYEVWSEPPTTELDNLRFLAGYRRDWLFNPDVLEELHATDMDGATLGEAIRGLPGWPEPLVRAALLHLLWRQYFAVDLTVPLSTASVLRRMA